MSDDDIWRPWQRLRPISSGVPAFLWGWLVTKITQHIPGPSQPECHPCCLPNRIPNKTQFLRYLYTVGVNKKSMKAEVGGLI
jgi:hypothetical protein